ncbi:MAG TPA: carboxypeptidase-like regulatory domain-containing protein [Verrucomicrobiae bacterium]|nr:carboxypeptidase-like regulatory domain-containing protein [Verrucomicrobiae bacterium]
MRKTKSLCLATLVVSVALLLAFSSVELNSQQSVSVRIDRDDIGGVVSSANGPEAGVWVIAETTDLPTKFAKIVVTDDRGRYLIPELPKANYTIWVRGYGLVDSPKVKAAPGKLVNLKAVIAPNAAAAAEYYPAIYWYSMLKIPEKGLFPGTGPQGNGMPAAAKSQHEWLDSVKTNGCIGCHQLGEKSTRTMPKEFANVKPSSEAWTRRIQAGQAMTSMVTQIARFDAGRAVQLYADWTDRVAAGELPKAKPPRPQGVERNIVITMWDWSRPTFYLHDEISTDRRTPTLNPYGKIYGATEFSTDYLPVLDPKTNRVSELKVPVRDPKMNSSRTDAMTPSPYWGAEPIWDSQTVTHNPMMDDKGRTWFTSRVRPDENPAFCQKGSEHPSAQVFPTKTSGRQVSMFDPKTNKFTLIDTCFGTHHLVFAEDANNTLWLSGSREVLGWIDTKKFDETGDEQKSQGWTPFVVDTNGNGKRDEYTEPNQPLDPAKDRRLNVSTYGIGVAPDGSIWTSIRVFPGFVVRTVPGPDPTHTALSEIYEIPWDPAKDTGYGPRGMDVDRNGVVWVPLSSGHLASFDRRKCKGPLNGPAAATGKHCPEGWTLYPFPGPQFETVKESGSAESSYYTWVDQHDTAGLGKDVPMATGNLNDGILALVDGKFITLRVPYPMGYYVKGLDGRIDDPKIGWKGRGLWSTTSTRAPFHMEGGKGTKPKVVKFQVRPDPLAK